MWGRTFGDAKEGIEAESINDVAVDPSGAIYTTGGFDGVVDLCDSGVGMTEAGATDLFVAKYAP